MRALVRREVLRLVGALSTSVGVKAAEQALLRCGPCHNDVLSRSDENYPKLENCI